MKYRPEQIPVGEEWLSSRAVAEIIGYRDTDDVSGRLLQWANAGLIELRTDYQRDGLTVDRYWWRRVG